nr:13035_t:CDS:2 [Entrophospora candida]
MPTTQYLPEGKAQQYSDSAWKPDSSMQQYTLFSMMQATLPCISDEITSLCFPDAASYVR